MASILTERLITHDEAKAAVQRFIDGHFKNADRDYPRIGIPARPDYDDDLVLMAYIKQQQAP